MTENKKIEILDKLNEIHELVAKSSIPMLKYNPISEKILEAKELLKPVFAKTIKQDSKEVTEKCPICGNHNNDCDKIF